MRKIIGLSLFMALSGHAIAAPPGAWHAPSPQYIEAACTRDSPCTGPRGGRYYNTQSGNKRYVPRR